MRRLAAAIATFVFAVALRQAAAATPILLNARIDGIDLTQAQMLRDPTGELDIDEVARGGRFGPMLPEDPENNQPPTRWLRFSAVDRSGAGIAWFLEVNRRCSSADLYVRSLAGFTRRSFGPTVPFARRSTPSGLDDPAVALRPEWLRGTPMYLRLECPGDSELASIVSPTEASEFYAAVDVPIFCSILACVIFGLLALVFLTVTREPLYFFVALAPLANAYAASAQYLPRLLPHVAFLPPAAMAIGGYAVFYVAHWASIRSFLQLRSTARVADTLFTIALVVLCLAEALDYAGPKRVALFVFVAQAAFYLVPIAAGVAAIRAGSRPARFFLAGLSVTAAAYILWQLGVNADLDPSPAFNAIFVIFLSAVPIESLLFFAGVADRLRTTERDRARAESESAAARSALVETQARHIAEIERRNEGFARFVPYGFLAQLARTDIVDVRLGDHVEREMAVMFTDIRAFTALAESMTPDDVIAFLNDYFERAGPIIRHHGGFVDKYIGDAIMALFPNGPEDAVEAALTLQNELRRFNESRARAGKVAIETGIGLNSGSMMLGTVGEIERYETTVISDAVNVASRLEGITKVVGAGIVAGDALVRGLSTPSRFHLRPLGEIELRGHARLEPAYEIFDGDPHELLAHKAATLDAFGAALEAYRTADFVTSLRAFTAIAATNTADGPARYFRDRSARNVQAADALAGGTSVEIGAAKPPDVPSGPDSRAH